jgi:hypothetical protein
MQGQNVQNVIKQLTYCQGPSPNVSGLGLLGTYKGSADKLVQERYTVVNNIFTKKKKIIIIIQMSCIKNSFFFG